jgi:hypothetical protein
VRKGIGFLPFSGSMVIGRERGELAAIEDGYMFFI